ncbi:MAG: pilus assembly protein TadG-related protein [Paracoccaceae bacterium]|nr:pilus assembly protein TadG-related protein [Paracoccaceae bacterium]
MFVDKNAVSPCAAKANKGQQGGVAGWLGRFWKAQDGAMSYVAVAGSLVMMVFGGIGIDMIQAELKRTKLQNTLDRAVLAAAALENELEPTSVVESYFDAMLIPDALQSVTIGANTATDKEVTASARTVMPSNFLDLLGVASLQAEGAATAANAMNEVEISMVLDISGSMRGDKIEQLKAAAKSFVDTVLVEGDDTVSISLVPYHATVNLGDTFHTYMNLQDLHDYSHCAVFDPNAFVSTAVTPEQELEQLGQFDPVSTSTRPGRANRQWCHPGNRSAIMPFSTDVAELHAHIDTFTAWGNTAIDLGMKWGTALLDPAIRPAIAAMADDGLVAPYAANRPAAFNNAETLKFVVLMTDGQNTTQYDLPDDMKTGARATGIWVRDYGTENMYDDRYSVALTHPNTGNTVYYWTRYSNAPGQRYQTTIDGIADPQHPAREMTWNELYDRFGTKGAAELLYRRPMWDGFITNAEYNALRTPYQAIVNDTQADARLSTICGTARDQGIVVYAIGVEAPQRGLDAMQDCASSTSHYFDVTGDELEGTFRAIARTLTTLRLTQ